MITNVQFNAEPKDTDQLKIGMDLKLPEKITYKFNVSGECDREFLKKIVRIIKSGSKTKETK